MNNYSEIDNIARLISTEIEKAMHYSPRVTIDSHITKTIFAVLKSKEVPEQLILEMIGLYATKYLD